MKLNLEYLYTHPLIYAVLFIRDLSCRRSENISFYDIYWIIIIYQWTKILIWLYLLHYFDFLLTCGEHIKFIHTNDNKFTLLDFVQIKQNKCEINIYIFTTYTGSLTVFFLLCILKDSIYTILNCVKKKVERILHVNRGTSVYRI